VCMCVCVYVFVYVCVSVFVMLHMMYTARSTCFNAGLCEYVCVCV